MNILHKITSIATLTMAIALFFSCSEEQTSMSVEDIQGKAKIVGSLSYDEGQDYTNGEFSELIKPAANVKVYVKVSNASLSPNGAAQGNTVYETVTDENGKYEIEVPATEKTEGTTVNIQPSTFVGKRILLKTVENSKPIFEEKEAVFSIAEITKIVKPNEIIVSDLRYGFKERDIDAGFTTTVPLSVKVGLGIIVREKDPLTGISKTKEAFEFKSGINVIVSVAYNDEALENNKKYIRKYGATTNSMGEIKLNIPAREKVWKQVPITIEVLPFTQKTFTYYNTEGRAKDIEGGIYKQYTSTFVGLGTPQSYTVDFDGIDGVTAYCEARMVFSPFAGVDAYGYDYDNYNWSGISFYQN